MFVFCQSCNGDVFSILQLVTFSIFTPGAFYHKTMDTELYGNVVVVLHVCSYLIMEHVLKARKYVT